MGKTINQYLLIHPKWQNELIYVRKILNDMGLDEAMK